MSEIVAQGRVIEARARFLVLSAGTRPGEASHPTKAHDALPGDDVIIWDDGQVEVKNRHVPPREIKLPTHAETDSPDHR